MCDMMNLNNYAENLGKKSIIVFVLIDLKQKEIKDDIINVMKAKRHIQNVFRKRRLFD